MKTVRLVLLGLVLAGCAGRAAPVTPSAGSFAADREICQGEAAAALYPSALSTPTPAERSYPWTAGRAWPQNSAEERLRERDLYESCMAQRGHQGTER
jgi:hypothetical protein